MHTATQSHTHQQARRTATPTDAEHRHRLQTCRRRAQKHSTHLQTQSTDTKHAPADTKHAPTDAEPYLECQVLVVQHQFEEQPLHSCLTLTLVTLRRLAPPRHLWQLTASGGHHMGVSDSSLGGVGDRSEEHWALSDSCGWEEWVTGMGDRSGWQLKEGDGSGWREWVTARRRWQESDRSGWQKWVIWEGDRIMWQKWVTEACDRSASNNRRNN